MNKLKYKYDLNKDTKGFFIASINDHTIWFAAKVLDSKLVQKMRPIQYIVGMIAMTKLCVVGVQLNWSQYILNELLPNA